MARGPRSVAHAHHHSALLYSNPAGTWYPWLAGLQLVLVLVQSLLLLGLRIVSLIDIWQPIRRTSIQYDRSHIAHGWTRATSDMANGLWLSWSDRSFCHAAYSDVTFASLMDFLDNLIAYTRPYTGFSNPKVFQLISFFLPDLVQCSTPLRDPMLIS